MKNVLLLFSGIIYGILVTFIVFYFFIMVAGLTFGRVVDFFNLVIGIVFVILYVLMVKKTNKIFKNKYFNNESESTMGRIVVIIIVTFIIMLILFLNGGTLVTKMFMSVINLFS